MLHSELCRAIENAELFLVYQPLFSLKARSLTGVEALVRWRHPSGAVMPPDDFIPSAEENGLLGKLGSFVLDQACRQLADWAARDGWPGAFTLAVSISGRELSDPGRPSRVAGMVRRLRRIPAVLPGDDGRRRDIRPRPGIRTPAWLLARRPGHRVLLAPPWPSEACALMLAGHARASASASSTGNATLARRS